MCLSSLNSCLSASLINVKIKFIVFLWLVFLCSEIKAKQSPEETLEDYQSKLDVMSISNELTYKMFFYSVQQSFLQIIPIYKSEQKSQVLEYKSCWKYNHPPITKVGLWAGAELGNSTVCSKGVAQQKYKKYGLVQKPPP